jgi:uncharacterized membrane protein (UPF0127 family)
MNALWPAGADDGLPHGKLVIDTGKSQLIFDVEIADDEIERAAGLMYRQSLADHQGMLFVYPSPRPVSFWMKNTVLSLDMLFIAQDGTVVSIAKNAVPLSEAPIPSEAAVTAVLEINGGLSDKYQIAPGAKVSLPPNLP